MAKSIVIGVDVGTSSTRAIAFDSHGRIVFRAEHPLRISYPKQGWVEQDAEELWEQSRRVVRQVLRNVPRDRIAAMGVTNQRETIIVWDRETGIPLAPAIVWQDGRTTAQCAALRKRGIEREIRSQTGLLLVPYFSATKLQWLLEHHAGVRRAARAHRAIAGTVDTWILWNLTGGTVHATDPSNASRTMLMELSTLRWSKRLLRRFNIPAAILPEIRVSDGEFGVTDARAIGAEIPIRAVLGDQQAALFGQGCTTRGSMKYTFGTGGFLVTNVGYALRVPTKHILTTVAWSRGGKTTYAYEVSAYTAGAAIAWLCSIGLLRDPAESECVAASVGSAGGVVFVPALQGLGAPYWDTNARGSLLGLTRATSRAHLVRSVLEGIAFQAADAVCIVAAMLRRPRRIRVDGKASSNNFLCQLFADVTRVSVERPRVVETTAYGVARLAAEAVGLPCAAHPRVRKFVPRFFPEYAVRLRQWRASLMQRVF